ncbi:MAG: polyprenyl synthetase family protein [Bacteroidota bacterium]|nr:polyprenyl synthetase family protein [Bacteroidota bacterium]MDP4233295.1 polyprenyl synthetase family protein [Bacteroidota bacterium]MDP4242085.1 polyprenyl synthetase family protein [Bacteroidota bacterium]MDP4288636.1 polyprenyl synthetase family protein [Bacteroidota bacterium]
MNSLSTKSRSANLDEIASPVEREMVGFNQEFRRAMISEVPVVNLVAKYIIRTKGKQVRPMLVLLAAKASGEVTEATYRAATLVELLHTATLVHDDVIDESDTRRGFASIRALWKNKVGVLMGDFLLAQGLLRTVETQEYHFLQITSRAVRRMSEGELYQLQKSRQLNANEADYFRIIGDKTASLFATCCELGAASVKENSYQLAMREYGECVGIAFQIRDDLFAFDPSLGSIGKPATTDFKDKKLTLPLLHALSKSSDRDRRHILSLIKNGKAATRAYGEVLEFVEYHGGVNYAVSKAEEYSLRAKESLQKLPQSESRHSLEAFASYVIDRVK